MYSSYPVPPAPVHSTSAVCTSEPTIPTTAAALNTTSNTTLTTSTWTSNTTPMHTPGSNHLGLPYTSFDPGPSTSGMYGGQGGVFPFPAYPSMHMPFDYQQVFDDNNNNI